MGSDPWKRAAAEAAVSGSVASMLSAALLAVAGRRERRAAAAPMNATSQWLWGTREALQAERFNGRHTAAGYVVHHLASTFWAVLHARALADWPAASRPGPALCSAAATGAIAALVDLKLTPERFTPGFQHRVSSRSLAGAYAMFALGLALGSVAVRRARMR